MKTIKFKICTDCRKRATDGYICEICNKFFCMKGCDQSHAFEHMKYWEANKK